MDQREYRTLILAGLLHDIGKLLNKPDPEGKKHAVYSVELLRSSPYAELLQNRFFDDLDFDLLCYLVLRHDPYVKDEDLPTGEGPWDLAEHEGLLNRIRLADGLSAGERSLDRVYGQEARGTRAVDSIFAPLDLGRTIGDLSLKYLPKALKPADAFPLKGIEPLTEAAYRPLQDDFRVALAFALEHAQGWTELEAWVYSLLERYTGAVPSAVHLEPRDVSLFDHARTSCALAAALYIRDRPEFAAIKPGRSTFLLIQGDISGVQDYIYSVANIGPGGVAKRLRARSFFVTALTEVIAHHLREELVPGYALPIAAQILGGGGQFVLLVPDLPPVRERLVEVRQAINRWLWQQFQGDLALIAESLPIAQNRLFIKEGNACQALDELRHRVEAAKRHRLADLLQILNEREEKEWDEGAFMWETEAASYSHGDCPSCERLPAQAEEGAPVDDRLCLRCHQDRVLSERIVKAYYIAYFKGRAPQVVNDKDAGWLRDSTLSFFEDRASRHVVLLADLTDLDQLDCRPYQLDGFGYEIPTPQAPALVRHFANHVPRWESEAELDRFCSKERACAYGRYYDDVTCGILLRPNGSRVHPSDYPILQTFGCISAAAAEQPDGSQGSQLLGVLRADVDHLGRLFSDGMGEVKSLSRLATLSRMTDLFFSGWVNETLRSPPDGKHYDRIYTVYSGGDDLCLVGPWDVIVDFAQHLAAEFDRYVAHNPNVTLSAAVAVTKPKFPIAKAARRAGAYLAQAKGEGRARLHLFGTTAAWRLGEAAPQETVSVAQLLSDRDNWGRFLDEQLALAEEDAHYPFSTSAAHRLLRYAEMCRRWQADEAIHAEELRWLSQLEYDLARNIKPERFPDQEQELAGVKARLRALVGLDKRAVMGKLRMPITWALLKHRRRGA